MMVTFISQCEKKALSRTRRVLDAFANRIGDNTWQTVITEEGLIAIKKLLRKTASKNTAVACHWARSRSRNELIWVVGNRRKFNSEGEVPVNRTNKNINHSEWETGWEYLPLIKALVAIAALLHDWGKATELFQDKLNKPNKKIGDPLRHEWISCLLLHALVGASDNPNIDDGWISLLQKGNWDEHKLIMAIKKCEKLPLKNLPPLAQWVAWLVLTHHRLPFTKDENIKKGYADMPKKTMAEVLENITSSWGYANIFEDEKIPKTMFSFPNGLLSQSSAWQKQVQKWAERLQKQSPSIESLNKNGAWRLVLNHARLCLMLGDHYFSSLPKSKEGWQSPINLYANTDKDKSLKQKLDEHLIGVSAHGLEVAQRLMNFQKMNKENCINDLRVLKAKSPADFHWQDHAVQTIEQYRKTATDFKNQGCFVVNVASTGMGKTTANAKMMMALSHDGESLRFALALGLRTLTLQTGDEYHDRLKIGVDEMAVLIGSSAIKELHERNKEKDNDEESIENSGSESQESLMSEELKYDEGLPAIDFLEKLFPKERGIYQKSENHLNKKNQAFLYMPVLVCTIDHLMRATETLRGGRYILPYLRLMSSDLMIDEVDDFSEKDLIAIGRLVHLVGMLGRKVMISSATIPPAVAEGLFNAYISGWVLYQSFAQPNKHGSAVHGVWVDEFSAKINPVNNRQEFAQMHHQFITQRTNVLQQQIAKRKAVVKPCQLKTEKTKTMSKKERILAGIKNDERKTITENDYFELMRKAAIELHQAHHSIDAQTGKRVSFGVIRVANIPPCINLAKYLMACAWDENINPKVMAYHSRQVLLLRANQEQHLDAVLKRKEKEGEPPKAFTNPIIRNHINQSKGVDVMFILVATPIEEVGRDHDFDWAVIEPSSYRSIIQLAGRVRRHRQMGIERPNIAIMQYNLRAIHNQINNTQNPAYCRPGFESNDLRLKFHNVDDLLDKEEMAQSVTAIPRIVQNHPLQPNNRLADLEHQALINTLTNYENQRGAGCLQGWIDEAWWLTALPQQINGFRQSAPELTLYRVWEDGKTSFCEKNEDGEFITRPGYKEMDVKGITASRLWLKPDYKTALQEVCRVNAQQNLNEEKAKALSRASKKYGEIHVRLKGSNGILKPVEYEYHDWFGLLELR